VIGVVYHCQDGDSTVIIGTTLPGQKKSPDSNTRDYHSRIRSSTDSDTMSVTIDLGHDPTVALMIPLWISAHLALNY
jgi:hypothetical protein